MELIREYVSELTKIAGLTPVVLPGTDVAVGDIIQFSGKTILGKPKIGYFQNMSSLENLEIKYSIKTADTVSNRVYNSSAGIKVNTELSAENIVTSDISFSKEGMVYICANDVKEYTIANLVKIKSELKPKITEEIDSCFLVTKLISAESVVVMQSSQKNGNLKFDTKKIIEESGIKSKINIKSYSGQSYFNDSINNVTLLMELIEIKFQKEKIKKYSKNYFKIKTNEMID